MQDDNFAGPVKADRLYTVAYSNAVEEYEVVIEIEDLVLAVRNGSPVAMREGQFYRTRREALTVALKGAQKKVADATAAVNALIAELYSCG